MPVRGGSISSLRAVSMQGWDLSGNNSLAFCRGTEQRSISSIWDPLTDGTAAESPVPTDWLTDVARIHRRPTPLMALRYAQDAHQWLPGS